MMMMMKEFHRRCLFQQQQQLSAALSSARHPRRRARTTRTRCSVPPTSRTTRIVFVIALSIAVLISAAGLVAIIIPMLAQVTTTSPSTAVVVIKTPLSLEDSNLVNRYLGGGGAGGGGGVTKRSAASRRKRRRQEQQQERERERERFDHHAYTGVLAIPNENPAVCLTPQCLDQAARLIARAFPDKPRETWWVPSNNNANNNDNNNNMNNEKNKKIYWTGLLAVRPFKAASSTTAGIALRMANRTGGCAVRYQHYTGYSYVPTRRRHQSLLFAPLRQPAYRAYSAAHYFDATATTATDKYNGSTTTTAVKTDDEIIQLFRQYSQKWKGGLFYNYLRGIAPSRNDFHEIQAVEVAATDTGNISSNSSTSSGPERVHAILRHDIIDQYDFLLIAERMTESAVVLALLTGLDVSDVLVRSSKVAGHNIRNSKGCFAYTSAAAATTMSPAVVNFTRSKEWLYMNYADEVLYRAANYSLDLTIHRLGTTRFQQALRDYQALQRQVYEQCPEPPGCTPGADTARVGQVTDVGCYIEDFGCGYECVDDIVSRNKQQQMQQQERIQNTWSKTS